jgi:polyhydroxybutyrate depolymerase
VCERADRIAAILALNGAHFSDPSRCSPSEPVNVLVMHGDSDSVNPYDGGGTVAATGAPYPSPGQTVATWADKNHCTGPLVDGRSIDIALGHEKDETTTQEMAGCPPGGAVDFWTVHGGGHVLGLGNAWLDQMWAYFSAHAKP